MRHQHFCRTNVRYSEEKELQKYVCILYSEEKELQKHVLAFDGVTEEYESSALIDLARYNEV